MASLGKLDEMKVMVSKRLRNMPRKNVLGVMQIRVNNLNVGANRRGTVRSEKTIDEILEMLDKSYKWGR